MRGLDLHMMIHSWHFLELINCLRQLFHKYQIKIDPLNFALNDSFICSTLKLKLATEVIGFREFFLMHNIQYIVPGTKVDKE